MINELHQLSVAMCEADVETESWYREYKPLPAIKKTAPCVRIVLSGDKVWRLESVTAEMGECLRKFCKGSNGGSFPAMNLSPLYRIEDEAVQKELSSLMGKFVKGQAVKLDAALIKEWCRCDNWKEKKFQDNYTKCFVARTNEIKQLALSSLLIPYPIKGRFGRHESFSAIETTRFFKEPQMLHDALAQKAFEMLDEGIESLLVLQILFDLKNQSNLSVILDETALEDNHVPSVGKRFTREFNQALMEATAKETRETAMDAFGLPFTPSNDPMPEVKLAGGFSVKLRTMFDKQRCQYRYGRSGNDTYPINLVSRQQLQNALEWIGKKEQQGKTWVKTDDQEILFVYPSKLPKVHPSFVSPFQRAQDDKEVSFEMEAQKFREYVTKIKEVDSEHYPDNMQFFILRKLDKARTKVVYTRCATTEEIISHSESWRKAAQNFPLLPPIYARQRTPFPLEVASIMNRVWKRDGTLASDKYKPVADYHGMELLLDGTEAMWRADLRRLMDNSWNLAVYAGLQLNTMTGRIKNNPKDKTIWQVREVLVLMGMFLHWLHIRRGDYVNEYPYLLGQMLKVSDALHELYCYEVRNGEIPPQLIGSGLYVAASETPIQTLAQLGNRMNPYITWAKTNKDKRITVKCKDKEGIETSYQGPAAGYLLSVYSRTADLLKSALTDQSRFNDQEKALLFIGYLASFPKLERKETVSDVAVESDEGGNENE